MKKPILPFQALNRKNSIQKYLFVSLLLLFATLPAIYATCIPQTIAARANGSESVAMVSANATLTLDVIASGGAMCDMWEYAWSDGSNYWNGISFGSLIPVYHVSYQSIVITANQFGDGVYNAYSRCQTDNDCESVPSSVSVYFPKCNILFEDWGSAGNIPFSQSSFYNEWQQISGNAYLNACAGRTGRGYYAGSNENCGTGNWADRVLQTTINLIGYENYALSYWAMQQYQTAYYGAAHVGGSQIGTNLIGINEYSLIGPHPISLSGSQPLQFSFVRVSGGTGVAMRLDDICVTGYPYPIEVFMYPSGHPQNQTVCEGGEASFTVYAMNATGYQWQKNNVDIIGANGQTFTISSVSPADVGSYRCIVSNAQGNTVSNPATLTIGTPVITMHPQNQTAGINSSTQFTVVFTPESANYKWQVSTNGGVNWTDITVPGSNPTYAGYTSNTLTVGSLNDIVAGNNGYMFRVAGTSCPGFYSNPATLTVVTSCTAPAMTAMANGSASPITLQSGSSVTLTANPGLGFSCAGNWEYAWSNDGGTTFWNGTSFSGGTNYNAGYTTLNINSLTASANYTVYVRCSGDVSCNGSSSIAVSVIPNAVVLYNTGSSNVNFCFNNSKINTSSPVFRVSGTTSGENLNRFQIEINTSSTFVGTSYLQTFTGDFVNNTQYEHSFTNLTPVNGAVYYVRVRASLDGGSSYSAWSTQQFSFTYQSTVSATEWQLGNDYQFMNTGYGVAGPVVINTNNITYTGSGTNSIGNGNFENMSDPGCYGYAPVGSIYWFCYSCTPQIHDIGAVANPPQGAFSDGAYCYKLRNISSTHSSAWGIPAYSVARNVSTRKTGVNFNNLNSLSFNYIYHDMNNPSGGGGNATDGRVKLQVYAQTTSESSASCPATSFASGKILLWESDEFSAAMTNSYYPSNGHYSANIDLTPFGLTATSGTLWFVNMTTVESSSTKALPTFYIDDVNAASYPVAVYTSPVVQYASFVNATGWDKFKWNQTFGDAPLIFKIQKSSNGSAWSDVANMTTIGSVTSGYNEFDISSLLSPLEDISVSYLRAVLTLGYGVSPSFVQSFGFSVLSEEPLLSCSSPILPSNGGSDVIFSQDLQWQVVTNATSYDVYFGKSTPPDFVTNTTSTFYAPVIDEYETVYYWKIVPKMGEEEAVGCAVWSFTTIEEPLPEILTWVGTISSDWNVAGNWNLNVVPTLSDDVVIPSNYINPPIVYESKSSPATCKDMKLHGGAVLTVNPNKALTIHGNLTIDGSLHVKSSGIEEQSYHHSQDASLMIMGNANGAGTFHVQRYFSGNFWHMIATPITQAYANIFTNLWLREFNEATNDWGSFIIQPTTHLHIGKGFGVWSFEESETRMYSGIINHGTISLPVQYTNNPNLNTFQKGWNLVGNPYPTAVNWNLTEGWIKQHIGSTIYLFSAETGNYITWNGIVGAAGPIIPMGQGFFVQAINESANLQIHNSARVHSEVMFKKEEFFENVLEIEVNMLNERYKDLCFVMIQNDASEQYDFNYDAVKFRGADVAPQLYSYKGEAKLAVNVKNDIRELHGTLISFEAGSDGQYVLHFKETMNNDFVPVIHDRFTNTLIPAGVNYQFSANQNDNPHRFEILDYAIVSNTESLYAESNINVWAYNHMLYVEHNSGDNLYLVVVYDMLGKQVLNSDKHEVNLEKLLSGVYIVKVYTEKSSAIKKISIP